MPLPHDVARCADDGTCPMSQFCARYRDAASTEPLWWTAFEWRLEDGLPVCPDFIEFNG